MNEKALNDLIVRMLAFGNQHSEHRDYWHGAARDLAEMARKLDVYKKGYDRYECLRTFNVPEFTQLFQTNLKGTTPFDSLIDMEIERRKKL
jgi:hypothetical protein